LNVVLFSELSSASQKRSNVFLDCSQDFTSLSYTGLDAAAGVGHGEGDEYECETRMSSGVPGPSVLPGRGRQRKRGAAPGRPAAVCLEP